MVFTPTTLPDLNTLDADALKAMLLAQHEQFTAQQEELQLAAEQLLSREHEIEHLKLLIAKLRRMQFGRKSEKVERQIEQLELKLEDLEANRAEATPQPEPEASLVHLYSHLQLGRRGVRFLIICRARPRHMSRSKTSARSAAAR